MQPTSLHITMRRFYDDKDWPPLWDVLRPAFRAGESYPCDMDIDEAGAKAYWLAPEKNTILAEDAASGAIVGAYYIRPDQGGLGDHVCNCGYVVAPNARRKGVASQMVRHSQNEARERGFLAMRFNLVVTANIAGVQAWQKAGFEIIGTVPRAFRYQNTEFVDAHIMYKWLGDDVQNQD